MFAVVSIALSTPTPGRRKKEANRFRLRNERNMGQLEKDFKGAGHKTMGDLIGGVRRNTLYTALTPTLVDDAVNGLARGAFGVKKGGPGGGRRNRQRRGRGRGQGSP